MNIGIPPNNRQKVAAELSKLLANEYVLFTKTKNAHWNIEGSDFYDKHHLFDKQADQLADIIDAVAERIRALGFTAPATLKVFLDLTSIKETILTINNSTAFTSDLLAAHEIIIVELRKNIALFEDDYADIGSSDFIASLLQEHEKTAWILRTILK